eukprot:2615241-Prymnesium_polylepis.1
MVYGVQHSILAHGCGVEHGIPRASCGPFQSGSILFQGALGHTEVEWFLCGCSRFNRRLLRVLVGSRCFWIVGSGEPPNARANREAHGETT